MTQEERNQIKASISLVYMPSSILEYTGSDYYNYLMMELNKILISIDEKEGHLKINITLKL